MSPMQLPQGDALKRCPRCGESKLRTEFRKDRSRKDGLFPWCKPCHSWNSKRWADAHPESVGRYQQKRDADPERRSAFLTRQAKYTLRRRYGATLEDYDRLHEEQNGLCAICGAPPSQWRRNGKGDRLHLDHDHERGGLRGLLCFHCNAGLGQFRDDPKRLRDAADYLERNAT